MAVTTLDDVEAALGRGLTLEETRSAGRFIDQVEADVLHYLPGYDLNPVTTETVGLVGRFDQPLTLPRYPVTAVTSVSVAGVALTGAEWTWAEHGYLDRVPVVGAVTSYVGFGWGYPSGSVSVSYSHGQTSASPLTVFIANTVAARLISTGHPGLESRTIGPFSERYDTVSSHSAFGLTADQLATLRRYRRVQGPIHLVSGANL